MASESATGIRTTNGGLVISKWWAGVIATIFAGAVLTGLAGAVSAYTTGVENRKDIEHLEEDQDEMRARLVRIEDKLDTVIDRLP